MEHQTVTYNPTTLIDGYKLDHRRQFPAKTEVVYSNWTPRDSRTDETEVVFFGLQYFLDKFLTQEWAPFFATDWRDLQDVLDKYTRRVDGYLGPNTVGQEHLRALWELGYMPLEFKALPEGSAVTIRTPMLTVENTHPDFAWLVNYFETLMSSALWMPCTSATTAFSLRKVLEKFADLTGADPAFIDWQGHDFSFRGMPGVEAAAMSGAGHLLSFTGTDTIPAIDWLEEFYEGGDTFVGGSVAATEHSVMCAGGDANERDTFLRLLDLYPAGIVSVVSDTWDLWNVLTNIVPSLKAEILGREGKLVIRPDSGDPVKIIVGDPDAPIGSPAFRGVIELLWETFGGTVTDKGYRLLDSHIGAIYGDSINHDRMERILQGLADKGFASSNMVFGVGSYSYQFVTRDTYGFAMKSTWVQIDGQGMPIFKDPVTDSGMKKSAKGRIAVINSGTDERPVYTLVDGVEKGQEVPGDCLQTVWKNGGFVKTYSLSEIRETVRKFTGTVVALASAE